MTLPRAISSFIHIDITNFYNILFYFTLSVLNPTPFILLSLSDGSSRPLYSLDISKCACGGPKDWNKCCFGSIKCGNYHLILFSTRSRYKGSILFITPFLPITVPDAIATIPPEYKQQRIVDGWKEMVSTVLTEHFREVRKRCSKNVLQAAMLKASEIANKVEQKYRGKLLIFRLSDNNHK